MPEYSFANCTNLISVMTYISAVGNRSFYQCKLLRKLYTPKRLRSIGCEAFSGCEQLEVFVRISKREPLPLPTFDLNGNLHKSAIEQENPVLNKQRIALLSTLYKIEQNAKEAEEMNNYNWGTEDTVAGLGDPLFRMNIDYRGRPPTVIPSRIKGIWDKGDSTYHFSIQSPSSLSEVGMRTLLGQNLINIMPIMNFVVKNGMTIILLGKQDGSIYSVYEILPAQSTSSGKDISLEFFHEMIERIKRPIPVSYTHLTLPTKA